MTCRVHRLAAVGAVLTALLGAGCASTVQRSSTAAQQLVPGSTDGGLTVPQSPGAAAPSTSSDLSVPGTTSSGAVGAVPVTGSTGTVPSTGTSTTTTAITPPTARRTTGPIKVGVLYTINDAAAPAGIDNGNTFTPARVVHAFVDSYNKSGGFAGRHIEPVYFGLHSYDSNYEGQIGAACSSFTDDNHVAVVISNLQYYSTQLLSCLTKAAVPLVSGDFTGPDRQDERQYPGFITPITMVGEDRFATVVSHLATADWLKTSDKVGVVVEDCPIDQRLYRNGLVPALRKAGVPVASTFDTQCFQSIQDFGAETSQMSNAVVRFRQAGVNQVMVVSQAAEANLVFAFSEVADSQRWYPHYSLSSISIPEALALNAADTQLANMKGVGWLPVLDTQNLKQAPFTPRARECLTRMQKEGVQPQSNTDYGFVYGPCDSFGLFDAILHATDGDATIAAVIRGTGKVGSSYVSSYTVNGSLRLWNGRIGPAEGRIFAFVDGLFRYTSPAFNL